MMLKAVPAQAGNGWRVFIQWASGRIQYISGFESLQEPSIGLQPTPNCSYKKKAPDVPGLPNRRFA